MGTLWAEGFICHISCHVVIRVYQTKLTMPLKKLKASPVSYIQCMVFHFEFFNKLDFKFLGRQLGILSLSNVRIRYLAAVEFVTSSPTC